MSGTSWFADDSFRYGGHPLNFGGIILHDKIAHFLAGAVLWLVGAHVVAPVPRFWVILALAVAWEVVELVRWLRWQHRRANAVGLLGMVETNDWPPISDQFSWRDIVATLAGALVAWGLTWR